MSLDAPLCYAALTARDPRFDGRFFVAVRTTGVYCRPICPAPTPKRANVEFFPCAAAAEAAGFRPCRRCRPETGPGTPVWSGTSAVVSRALRLIEEGTLDEARSATLAARVGLGDRQLRRLFERHLGASPVAIARARRVHFAKRLLEESGLPTGEVAYSAGFRSLRQFHHAIRKTFGRPPSELRRRRSPRRPKGTAGEGFVVLRLAYRPPFDWRAFTDFLRPRATPSVEVVDPLAYRRTIEWGERIGTIEVSPIPAACQLELRIDLPTVGGLVQLVSRVRRMFDLDADPLRIAAALGDDPTLARLVDARPGLRVPGAWDGFELAVRAILGQQVSVRAATTLAGRMAERYGRRLALPTHGLTRLFPTPEALVEADLSSIGLTRSRATAVRALARAVASRTLLLEPGRGIDEVLARLTAVPGIGPWTAQYVALRALGEPDAFPSGDLGLRRALANGAGLPSARALAQRAESWRPWRAYAAIHLWTSGAKV